MINIEVMHGDDYIRLLDIYRSARLSVKCFPCEEVSLSEFKGMINGEVILTAKYAGIVVGFASIWKAESFIRHLYVVPGYQSMGIGTLLLEKCKEYFELPLSLKCIENNARACQFYERNGWKPLKKGTSHEGTYILFLYSKT